MKRLLILIGMLTIFSFLLVLGQVFAQQQPAEKQQIGPQSPPIANKILNPPAQQGQNNDVQTGIDQNAPTGIQEMYDTPSNNKKALSGSEEEYIKSKTTP